MSEWHEWLEILWSSMKFNFKWILKVWAFYLENKNIPKAHSLCKQWAQSSFFEKGILIKPFKASQSWHQLSFFEKGILVQNFLLNEWTLKNIFSKPLSLNMPRSSQKMTPIAPSNWNSTLVFIISHNIWKDLGKSP